MQYRINKFQKRCAPSLDHLQVGFGLYGKRPYATGSEGGGALAAGVSASAGGWPTPVHL